MNRHSKSSLFSKITPLGIPIVIFFSLISYPNIAKAGASQSCEDLYVSGKELVDCKDYEEAIATFKAALPLDYELAYSACEVQAIYAISRCYLKLSNNIEALKFMERYLSYPEEVTDALTRMKVMASIPDIYRQLGLFERSLEEHVKLLTLRDSLHDTIGLAQSNYELGTLFYDQENYVQSNAYFETSLNFGEELKDTIVILNCYSALGSNHHKMGNLGRALYYNEAALDLGANTKLKNGNLLLAYAEMNMGSLMFSMENLIPAEVHLKRSIELFKTIGYKPGLASAHLDYGILKEKAGDLKVALAVFQEGLVIAKEIKSITKEGEFHQSLSALYQQLNQIDSAYYHLEMYSILKDSIINQEQQKRMDQVQFKYELEKNAREIEYLKQDIDLLNQKKVIDIRLRFLYIASFLLVLLALAFTIYGYKFQKDNNAKLTERNEKINEQNDQLTHLNAELKEFAYIASHDMREPLRSIGAFSSLLERQHGAKLDQSGKEYLTFIRDAVNRMTLLLTDLLDYSKINSQQAAEWVDLRGVIQTAISNLHYQIEAKEGRVEINHKSIPYVKAVPTQMMQLFQNLISNALKFRKEEEAPFVFIDGYLDDNGYVISIKDNGIGMDPQYKDKIFGMFSRLNNKDQFEGTGIGLATCRKIVTQHNGRIWVESEEGVGSTFFIWIPKKGINFSQRKVLAKIA
ncbi:MAG: ATP-binding protein [Saprospiraceae bacterium]